MYNVACAVVIDVTKREITIFRNLDLPDAYTAITKAKINMALDSNVHVGQVSVRCYCQSNEDPDVQPAGCDPALRGVCELLK